MFDFLTDNNFPRGKKIANKRREKIEEILIKNNCYIGWNKNEKGHLFYIKFKDDRNEIIKEFTEKSKSIYHRVNLFYDFVEETLN